MAKWKNVRLGDIVKIQQTTCAFGGDKVWLLNLDMIEQNTGKIIDYYYTNTFGNSTIAFDEEHVLYSKLRPNLNKVVCPNGKGFATSELLPLLPNKEYITKEYLAEYLRSSYFVEWAVSKTAGAKMPRLAPKELMNKSIPLPDLETQRKIAANLDKVTHTIDLCNAILEKLDLLVKSRFVEMFGDTEVNNNNHPVHKLSDLCTVSSSKRIYQEEQSSSGVPFLRISNLVELIDNGIFGSDLFIPEEKYNELFTNGLVPKADDILVTSRGTLGKCYIIQEHDKFYFQDGMISWLYDIDKSITPLYLTLLFDTRDIKRQIENLQSGSTVAYLSIAMLKKLNIVVPPLALQQQFAAFVEQTDKSKFIAKKIAESVRSVKIL